MQQERSQKSQSTKSFKQRKNLQTRKDEVSGIKSKFPTKVPVIVERYQREKSLPLLDKTKFLVPRDLSMTQFVTIIRSRLALDATQAFYLLVNNKSLATMSLTLAELYKDHQDEDGFLYMTYASQEMFGFALPSTKVKSGMCLKRAKSHMEMLQLVRMDDKDS